MKLAVWLLVGVGLLAFAVQDSTGPKAEQRRDLYLRQLENKDEVPQTIRSDYAWRGLTYVGGFALWGISGAFLLRSEIQNRLTD